MASLTLVTGCGKATGSRASDQDSSVPVSSSAPSVNPSYGEKYLAERECAAPESGKKDAYREAPCDAAEAVARVTDRFEIGSAVPVSATGCPAHTDFVIDTPISLALLEGTPATGEGYACMRNLKPPHPGDPGQGGGPRIEIGDCVHSESTKADDVIEEVACRTRSKRNGATYKITNILEDRSVASLTDPCEGEADAEFSENPMFGGDPTKNERLLCGKKL
ncbi:hypothetical protein ACFVUT_25180 [Streptomyces sp. NPDC058051]|uniref:hypothetical protein n=1 Tax=Streptomyces sp. NPDC058051 TaxID=3346315 RepID=UPI0036E8DDC0